MNIEITGETEQLIRAAIAAGQYASAEEFIAAMATAGTVGRYKNARHSESRGLRNAVLGPADRSV